MQIKLSIFSRRIRITATIVVAMIVAGGWLILSISQTDVEKLMYEHFNARLNGNIDRIDCHAEAVGNDFRPQLACNYRYMNKTTWDFKYIDLRHDVQAPVWAVSSATIDFIYYERHSSRNILFQIHSYGSGASTLNRADAYAILAVVDAISNAHPR